MKIILAHNHYQQPGGEDRVYSQERHLLESHGHEVVAYERSNSELLNYGLLQKLRLPKDMIWSSASHREMLALLRREKPDIVHVHNTLMQISPSIFGACREAGVPVVQTLHNFRLLCPGATFFRNGRVCEDCQESSLLESLRHACYRDSLGATAMVAAMLKVHRQAGTWTKDVNLYIALTEFSRQKFIDGGLPAEKIVVKSNFVSHDPGPRQTAGEGAVFVGRLSPEKGVRTLLRAWGRMRVSVPLRIYGDGPLRGELERMATDLKLFHVSFLGQVSADSIPLAMKSAQMVILPSECYENFPLAIVETFACGTPMICSRLGAMQEIVAERETGLLFSPGDPDALAEAVEWAWNNPRQLEVMGKAARREFEQKYTAEKNYAALMEIYFQAKEEFSGQTSPALLTAAD
jgi:glycosyltransferase involved in cell wall biosynthesis